MQILEIIPIKVNLPKPVIMVITWSQWIRIWVGTVCDTWDILESIWLLAVLLTQFGLVAFSNRMISLEPMAPSPSLSTASLPCAKVRCVFNRRYTRPSARERPTIAHWSSGFRCRWPIPRRAQKQFRYRVLEIARLREWLTAPVQHHPH